MLNRKTIVEWSFEMNENIQKVYHSHHNANTIDMVFIANVINDVITVKLESEDV